MRLPVAEGAYSRTVSLSSQEMNILNERMNSDRLPVQNRVGQDSTLPSQIDNQQILIDGLNHDLAGEYQAILMYTHFSAKLTGPYRRELRALFQAEIPDEQGHAQFLAEKIANLGGEPTTIPRAGPHAQRPKEMLVLALQAEVQAISDYGERIQQAEELGDVGLKVNLENQVSDETRHKEEIERILAGWND